MNYIITKHPEFFDKVGSYNFCDIEELRDLPEEIAFDSETTGLDANLEDMFCCQIGTGKDNYIVHMYDDNYTFHDVIPYLKDKTLVMQNGIFDLQFMYKYNFIPKRVFDTMLATKILYNGDYQNQRADFGSIMKRELDVVYDKTTQKNIHIVKLSVPSAIKYSFNDVDRLLECHDVLMKKIEDGGFLSTYLLHCRFAKALAYMEMCGLPINEAAWMDKMEQDEKNVEISKQEINDFIHEHAPKFADRQLDMFQEKKEIVVNLNSPQQMVEVFKSFEINTKDKDGKDSTDSKIISKSDHPFVPVWLKYQEASHRVSTFGKNILDKVMDGRIYTSFNPMVDTARLSSRKGGINFLNFPKDEATRNCFEAPRGRKMIVCDWSGQETVIMADQSGDVSMTKSVVDGRDLHSMLARELFPEISHLSDKEIETKHSDKRTKAKAPRFAMQYGGNAYTLHVNENMPLKEAEIVFNKFKELHKELFEWGERNLYKAIKKGYIESVDGWKLKLPKFDWFSDLKKEIDAISKEQWSSYRRGKAERQRQYKIDDYNANLEPGQEPKEFIPMFPEDLAFYKSKRKRISDFFKLRSNYQRLALNNPIQTRGAHQMKLALCYIFEWIVEKGYMWEVLMCNAVHDETVCESPDRLAEEVKAHVEHSMRVAGDYYLDALNIKADANIGQTWYEAK